MELPLVVKDLPAIQETWVPSLSQEDPLEESVATHFIFLLSGAMPWTEESGSYNPQGHTGSDMPEATEYSHT